MKFNMLLFECNTTVHDIKLYKKTFADDNLIADCLLKCLNLKKKTKKEGAKKEVYYY